MDMDKCIGGCEPGWSGAGCKKRKHDSPMLLLLLLLLLLFMLFKLFACY